MARSLPFLVAGLCLFQVLPARADPRNDDPVRLLNQCKRKYGSGREPGTEAFLRETDALLDKAAAAPPDKRRQVIGEGLGGLNGRAEDFAASAGPDKARQVHADFSELNNSVGDWARGRRFADKALSYDPDDRDALLNRSNANYGLRRFDEAYSDAERVLTLEPTSAEAYRSRAMASYGLRNYLQATEDARQALALDPNDRVAFAIMKLAEGKVPALDVQTLKSGLAGEIQREYHGMVQQLNQAAEKRPEPPEALGPRSTERLLRNAASKLAVKDYWGALAEADKTLSLDPASRAAYYYRAAANNLLGRYEEAARDATRALMIDPGDNSSRDTRAWAFNHMGRFRDAIADSNHALEVNPEDAYAFANLGYSHEQMGDLSAMLSHLKTAAALNPQFEPAYRDAASRHGLDAEALASDRFKGPQPPSPREEARRRSFAIVLTSSLIGGILIALGFLHLFGPWGQTQAARAGQASGRVGSAIDASYSIGPSLGMGGMGVVHEAVDRALQRKVAIKMIREEFRKDRRAKERFLQEARTVAALHHPGIVDIHSIFEDEAGLYLVFEYIVGRTLDQILLERGKLPLSEAKAILKQVCQALDFAHRHDVVHRDLKPANIMVSEQGLVKVMDFGISRQAHQALQDMGRGRAKTPASPAGTSATAMGTPYYMAPEQEYGVVRKESDVFSLGACLYEMLTGQRPYPGPASAPQKATRDYRPASELVPGLPKELDGFIDWALHPDPEQRIRAARDFWALLDRIRDQAAIKV